MASKEPVEPNVTFDSRFASEKTSFDLSRDPSKLDLTCSQSKERSTKHDDDHVAPDDDPQRPPLEAMRSLSVVSEPQAYPDSEPNWPSEPRAYLCLFGGFLL